ncbi:MAG: AzlC family ABC transporter permease [Anaerolineales bacterium]|nr:AzlC family ABC transporter permease [Anaerolineales bacterium]
MLTPRSEFMAGVRGVLPLLAGVAPFGLIFGVLGISAGLSPALTCAMSLIAFGGSAQFIAVQQMSAVPPVPDPIVVLTTLVVNLRHMLYSATLGPHLHGLARRWKLVLAYLLTDEAFAVTIVRYQQPGGEATRHWYFLGAGLGLWSTWQITTLVGVLAGTQVPPSWGLDFTLALTFIGILAPTLKDWAVAAAAGAAGLAAVAAHGLPLQLGLIVAAVVGIAAGMVVERVLGMAAARQPEPEGGD